MGRSKQRTPVRRPPDAADDVSRGVSEWLSRRTTGSLRPEALLAWELGVGVAAEPLSPSAAEAEPDRRVPGPSDEGRRHSPAQRVLFYDVPIDAAKASRSNDQRRLVRVRNTAIFDGAPRAGGSAVAVTAVHRRGRARDKQRARRSKRVSFSDELVVEISPPEVSFAPADSVAVAVDGESDSDSRATDTLLWYHAPRTAIIDPALLHEGLDEWRYRLGLFPLPRTKVMVAGAAGPVTTPHSVPVVTSLGVVDLWRRYGLPGSAAEIAVAVGEGLLRVELVLPASDGETRDTIATAAASIALYLTDAARSRCGPAQLPWTGGSFTARRRLPTQRVLTVLEALYPALAQWGRSDSDGPLNPVGARRIYHLIDNVQLQTALERENPNDDKTEMGVAHTIPGLVPTLRPYQQAAVDWMLRHEKDPPESREWELLWMVLTEDGQCIFLPEHCQQLDCSEENAEPRMLLYNPLAGWIATSYAEAKIMTLGTNKPVCISGGILAESMGLGKTVEVLACILAHRRPVEAAAVTSQASGSNLDNDGILSPMQFSAVVSMPTSQMIGYVNDLADFGQTQESSEDESIHMPVVALTSTAVPITPEKPRSPIREKWMDNDELGSCICGELIKFETKPNDTPIVICSSCREPMHLECTFLDPETENSQFHYRQLFSKRTTRCILGKPNYCPSCMVSSNKLLESGATLIITPPAILDQWEFEIQRHTTRDLGLNVIIYHGVKACQTSKKQAAIRHLHPAVLGSADIVLMTFDTLMSDLGHSDENRFVTGVSDAQLRKRKRYRVIPSPLISVKWWRVILDEAQRVETPTAGSAKMALKLQSFHRWAVTGTPLGRGKLDDLFGLLLFLRLDPFTDKQIFHRCFHSSRVDVDKRISHLLSQVIWRSTKKCQVVVQQLGIPEQHERKVFLHFSSVEKHFYYQQLEVALSALNEVEINEKMGEKRRASHLALVSDRLYHLRAACCHPQVGSGGLQVAKKLRRNTYGLSDSLSKRVMTMEQILITFIEHARLKCEEALRLAVMHRNAMAAIMRLKIEAKQRNVDIPESDGQLLQKSRDIYNETLALVSNHSVPSPILGEGNITGSMGLCSLKSFMKNGSGVLAWKYIDQLPEKIFATIDFEETSKKITQLRLRPILQVPTEVREETSDEYTWRCLCPKRCILQVQANSVGDEFIDVVSFSLAQPHEDAIQWTSESGFLTNKSNSWRIIVKDIHSLTSMTFDSPFGLFIGIEVELHEANIDNDPIQRLHTVTNSIISCQALSELEQRARNGEMSSNANKQALESEAARIECLYLDRARSLHLETKKRLAKATEERIERESSLWAHSLGRGDEPVDCWDDGWWRDFLVTLQLHGTESQKDNVLTKLSEDVHVYIEGHFSGIDSRGVTKFPPFVSLQGFLTALELRIDSIRSGIGGKPSGRKNPSSKWRTDRQKETEDAAEVFMLRSTRFKVQPGQHAACMAEVTALSTEPSTAEVFENSNCSVCKVDWYKNGPKCRHCHLGSALEDLTPDRVTEGVLRVLSDIVRGTGAARDLRVADRAKAFFDVLEAQRREKIAAYRMWRVHLDLLNDLDELNQVKSTMRLSHEGEDLTQLTEDEKNAVVQPVEIHHRYHEHASKEAMAQGDLRRAQEKLRYLQGLVHGHSEESECPICLSAFNERAVLRCGHSLCRSCLEGLQAHTKEQAVTCPKKCAVRTSPQDVLFATSASRRDGTAPRRPVKGSFGTKVTHLVADILGLAEAGDKGVVFSQWEDMLDIIQSALAVNGVGFVRADSKRAIGESVARFRASPSVTVFLLNVKHGAEGLTLLEATHCFMVEPILNHGLDTQAISRIHRMGQRRRTYVHRYLMVDTIETKIDRMREEQHHHCGGAEEEEALEESLNEGRRSVIRAGGIDGGFGSQQEVIRLLSLES